MAGLGKGVPAMCAICNPKLPLFTVNNIISDPPMTGFPVCITHSKEEVDKKRNEFAMERNKHKTETEGQDSTDRSSRTQIGGDISSTVSDPRPLPPAASSPAQSSFPSRAAEFLVQNLPPQRSVTSSAEFDQRQAEKLVDLAYAWGQLEVASSAMANAYERLKGIGEQQLPARSLRLRMRKFKQAARDVESLLPKKHARDTKEKGAEGEDAEEKGVGEKDADEKDAGEKDGEINVSAG